MLILITYDVATTDEEGARRLRRIARACADYGIRVQKSVFECQLGPKEWVTLRARLLQEFNPDLDSLRFYYLDAEAAAKTEHHGTQKPLDLSEPLIL
ncbi:MAG: CRISPR-associated endonuclease Cas2 [Methylacidiphilales bacterium]|nr:CRISPR-associated endonuclease Cas2 [Candidatus Methylacidiphilales bacterium]